MKILQTFDFFSLPHGGGTVDVLYRLSRALMQMRHEVVIYTSDFELDQEYIDSLQGVKVYPFRSWLNLPGVHLIPGMIRELKRKLKDFDIIHLHCFQSFSNIVIHYYAKKYGIPYLLHAHGSLPRRMEKQELKQGLKRIYDTLWGYKLLRDASKVIALTKIEAEQYKSMGVSEDKIEIVPNGIDISEFEELPEKGEFRRKFGLNSDEKIILYLGRIHETKGLDLLTKAFAGVSRQLDDARLAIVGADDGYLLQLERLITDLGIGDRVLFTGPLYGKDKLEAYVDADVHVSPRSWEPFGLTLIESCACGTPVICSQGCGIADILCGPAGLAVPYDEDQLRDALLHILNDDKLRQEYGEKGKSLVRQQFAWPKIAGQVENLYQQILAEHH